MYRHQILKQRHDALKHAKQKLRNQTILERLALISFTLFFITAGITGSILYASKTKADSPSPDYENLKTFDTSASGASAEGVDSTILSNGTVYAIGTCSGSVTFDGVGGSDTQDCVGQPDNTGQSDSYLTKYNPNGSYGWTKLFDPNTSGSAVNASGIASDNTGDVYITGTCISTVTFDGVGGSDNQDCGANSVFLTKYNADGSYGWTKTVLAGGVIFPSIAVDSSGDIFVSSNFCGSVTFDGAGGSNTQDGGSSCANGAEIFDKFLTKYNPDGSYAWTQLFGVGSSADDNLYGGIEQLDWGAQGNTIALDSSGNIYITGSCAGAVTFDGPSGSDTQDCIRGNTFITKYNADGSYGWTTLSGANGMDNGVYDEAIAIDSSDNIYVTGTCDGDVTFDGVGGSDTQSCSGGNGTLFLTKYNPDGSYGWTHIAAHPYNNYASLYPEEYIKTDSSGNIYLSGECTEEFTFDGPGGSDTQDCGGGYSGFITKFNSDGSYAWTQLIGGSAYGIETDGDNVYLTGSFSYLGDECIYTTSANSDMYLLEFTNATATDFCITTTNLPDGTAGTSYSQQIQTADDTPGDFSIASGSLPPGLSIDPNSGIISGIPSTAGTYDFTVSATGQVSNITATSAPLSISIDDSLAITTTSLPDGVLADPYSQSINTSGSETPSDFTVASGSLPPGLSIDPSSGNITGTPTTIGTYNFTISVTGENTDDTVTSGSLSITIDAFPPGYLAESEIGQTDNSGDIDWTQNAENNNQNSVVANGLNCPSDTALDSTNHRLFVDDDCNNRILIYQLNDQNQVTSQTPIYELGQGSPGTADFTDSSCNQGNADPSQNSLCYPYGLVYDSTSNTLFVSDNNNSRILAFNVAPSTIQDGENATYELGQGSPGTADFTDDSCNQGNTDPSQNNLCYPAGLAYDSGTNLLYVSDQSNSRILAFNVGPSTIQDGENATYELGQGSPGTADFTDNNCNQGNTDPSQNSLCYPVSIAYDSGANLLYVSDQSNSRILSFNVAPSTIQNGENATYELGQGSPGTADFTDNNCNQGNTDPSQNSLCYPVNIAYDSANQNLFVADGNNERILDFNVSPNTIQNAENASGLIGNQNYTSTASCVTSQSNVCGASGGNMAIDPTNNSLFVPDSSNNRIMVFDFADLQPSAPGGVAGSSYSFSTSEYYQGTPTFSITSGSLPPGLSLNSSTGVISGTPTTAGNYSFNVNLSDNNGPAGTFIYTLNYTIPVIAESGSGGSSGPPPTQPSPPAPSSPTNSSSTASPSSPTTTTTSTPPIINLDNQTTYEDGSGYTTTALPGQTYTFTGTNNNTPSTVTVKAVIPPKTAVLNIGGTNTITMQTGQTVTESASGSNSPTIKIKLVSVSGNQAHFIFTKVKLASNLMVAPIKPTIIKPTKHHWPVLKAILLAFPWLLFALLGLISLNFVYRAYEENKRIKQAKAQLAWATSLSEQKQNFITLSSHYFRTPFTLISSGVELATEAASNEIKADFKVITDKLKQAIDQLVSVATSPTTTAAPAVVSSEPIEQTKGSSYLFSFLAAAYVVVGLSYIALDKLNLYNLKLIAVLEQIAALALFGLLAISAHKSLQAKQLLENNTRELLDKQNSLDNSRNETISQALLVLDVPVSQIKAKLLSLDDPKLTKPALDGVSRLGAMLNKFKLITLLKADTGQTIHKETIDLNNILADILPKYETTIKTKQLNIKTDLKAPNVYQSRALLAEAIDTLVSNAVKYSPEHSSVTIASAVYGDKVSITVADQGIGIAKDKLPQIFEPFSRAENAAKDFNQEGMGLSLYMDSLIMDYLGGSIDIDTAKDINGAKANHGTATSLMMPSGNPAS